jgi:hypothetical protein
MMSSRSLLVGSTVALALGAAACDNNNITSLNRNPNSPEDVPATTIFTNAVRTAVGRWLGAGYDLRATEFLIQHLAEVQYPDEDRYTRLTGSSTTGYFDAPYRQELEDFQKVVQKGMAAKDAGTYGPALVMRTWVFSYLTNTWGDIPYFQALKGDSSAPITAPAYDPQQAIYTDMFKVLTQASTDLTNASASLGGADPIYGGDPAAWQKFANSLHARLALTMVNVDPAQASSELKAAFTAPGGLITSNADNAKLVWPGDGVYDNPWAANFKTRDDERASRSLVSILGDSAGLRDPRLYVYAMPAQKDTTNDPYVTKYCPPGTSCFVGLQNGLTQGDAFAHVVYTSRPGAVFFPGATAYGYFGGQGQSWPSFLMTAAEVLLIEAEAAERGLGGLTPAQAKGFYNAAIQASFAQWGLSPAAATAYLSTPAVAYQGGTGNSVAGLKLIALQKWIALYTDGGTAWTEWRRTCVPLNIRPGPDASRSAVPRRFMYSITEQQVNKASWQAAVARQGPDQFETKMWWDKPTAAPTYDPSCGQQVSG